MIRDRPSGPCPCSALETTGHSLRAVVLRAAEVNGKES